MFYYWGRHNKTRLNLEDQRLGTVVLGLFKARPHTYYSLVLRAFCLVQNKRMIGSGGLEEVAHQRVIKEVAEAPFDSEE